MRAASIRASRSGLPISSVMSCAICSTRRLDRVGGRAQDRAALAAGRPDQAGKAAAAAATAASTSSAPDAGTRRSAPTAATGLVLLVGLAGTARRPLAADEVRERRPGRRFQDFRHGPHSFVLLIRLGCRDDRVHAASRCRDVDLDDVAGLEREVVRAGRGRCR